MGRSQVQRPDVCTVIKFALTAWAEALPGLAHCIYAVRAECMAALDHPILLSAAIAHLQIPKGRHAWPLQTNRVSVT